MMPRPRMPRSLSILLGVLAAATVPHAVAQYMEPALGRLFTTPEERMSRERNREVAPAAPMQATTPPPTAPAVQAPPVAPPAPVRLTGVVRRSDGRATVWIDDTPRETTLRHYRPGSPLPIDTPAGRVLVKPGQSYDPNDGAIRDPR
ncbi:hypothetical protein [Pseudoduganella lutea]|uniref:Uncharacterized protein n=1 Tax=Pseudoduganella lutea TaxID=321985 RepID=A0A4P6L4U1_9BURK|nr:hypothetical protein [Pseudoduganella lutea]QBE66676.1 hypothetical protein EWM63_29980 [Pseudoduganella lutea]